MENEIAYIVFKNAEGKEIKCTVQDDVDGMDLSMDFGEKGGEDHNGLYVSLLNLFVNSISE